MESSLREARGQSPRADSSNSSTSAWAKEAEASGGSSSSSQQQPTLEQLRARLCQMERVHLRLQSKREELASRQVGIAQRQAVLLEEQRQLMHEDAGLGRAEQTLLQERARTVVTLQETEAEAAAQQLYASQQHVLLYRHRARALLQQLGARLHKIDHYAFPLLRAKREELAARQVDIAQRQAQLLEEQRALMHADAGLTRAEERLLHERARTVIALQEAEREAEAAEFKAFLYALMQEPVCPDMYLQPAGHPGCH